MKPRYLTKSRFKLALECPTKLYYDGKPEYANQSIDDHFLLALAEGGFQVGELAKIYFPGGFEIETLNYNDALLQTNELLNKDDVIIYEAAFCFGNLFVRVDIVNKNKNKIELIEVKAKSFDSAKETEFLNKNGSISSGWQPYLFDIAFQKHVVISAFPGYEVSAFLMMADKNALCPTDGLNQKFKIGRDENGRKKVFVSPELCVNDLSDPILSRVRVDKYCDIIFGQKNVINDKELSFAEYVSFLAEKYVLDEKIISPISAACVNCEYSTNKQDVIDGLKSGFQECWKNALNWEDKDFQEPTVFDIWNFRKKDKLISDRRIKLNDIVEDDIAPKGDSKPGISPSQRQWMQVQKAKSGSQEYWLDVENMKLEMASWKYPLHFIDFETSMVAIPFNKGRRPYEGIAFQFSHHVVHENGQIEHCGQYLNTEQGVFPNYDFVRKLKNELENDKGSIFRYAAHENTFLNMIRKQLLEDQDWIPDKDELCRFICSITQAVSGTAEPWTGERNMVDMCELVKRYYYDPAMRGSNSIKKVLPAILNSSMFLQEKYFKPIYGSADGIKSLNYNDWTWIKFEDGQVLDPYKLLPKMFQDISEKDFSLISDNDELRDGGAALTAYARMQFEEMSEYERNEISKALLKYCELDTFAMVMIYEAWKDFLR